MQTTQLVATTISIYRKRYRRLIAFNVNIPQFEVFTSVLMTVLVRTARPWEVTIGNSCRQLNDYLSSRDQTCHLHGIAFVNKTQLKIAIYGLPVKSFVINPLLLRL